MLPPLATALDTETALVTVQRPVAQLVSVAVAGGLGRDLVAQHHRERVLTLYRGTLRVGLIAQNAPYDLLTGLVWSDGALLPDIIEAYESGNVFDTMTRQKMLDIATGGRQRRRYNLGAIAARYGLVADKEFEGRTKYADLLGLEVEAWPQAYRDYALADADVTHAVAVAQDAAAAQAEEALGLRPGQIFGTAEIHARAHIALYQQTVIGWRTDPAAVAVLVARIEREIAELGEQVVRAGLARWGGTKKAPQLVASTKAAAAAVEQHCAANDLPVPLTPTERVSLSEDSLIALRIPKGHPLDSLRRWKSRRSLATQRIPALQRPTWRTRYDECVDTSRTSASGPQGKRKPQDWTPDEWTGGNGQNFPNAEWGWRECLVPSPGHVLVISDWGGAELVTLAQIQIHLFGSSDLGEVLADPARDAHRELAATMFGKPEAEIDKDERKAAKPANFGFPVDMGPRRFVDYCARAPYNLTIDEATAAERKRAYFARYREARPYLDWVSGLEGYDGRITMAHPVTGFVRGGMFYTEAANFPFQHLAAMGAKIALWRLWRAQYDPSSPLRGCPQLLFVHDENVTQCTPDRAEEVKAEQERIMIEAFAEVCPDVPIRVDSHIASRYTKD
jgi:hypothetical protein